MCQECKRTCDKCNRLSTTVLYSIALDIEIVTCDEHLPGAVEYLSALVRRREAARWN